MRSRWFPVLSLVLTAVVLLGGGGPDVAAARTAGIAGAGVTGMQVQNMHATESAIVTAYFYPVRGGAPVQVRRGPIAPYAATNFYPPAMPELDPGKSYSVVLNATRPVAVIGRTDWPASGGAAVHGAPRISTDVVVPLVMKDYYGQTSIVSVQATGGEGPVTATFELYETGADAPTLTFDLELPANTSTSVDLARYSQFANVPGGFLGSVRITADREVAVSSFVDIATSRAAVYAFNGVPAESASDVLYAPLIRSRQDAGDGGFLDTGISVANPGETPVEVTVHYSGGGGSCAGHTSSHGAKTIGGHSSAVFYQGPPSGAPEHALPANCYGSARIVSEGGDVLAVVNDSKDLTALSAAYNAIGAAEGATGQALPLVRSQFAGYTTGIQATNVSSTTTTAVLRLFDERGDAVSCQPADACTATLEPGASATWWPPSVGVPDEYLGSAVVEADQPLAVLVNDYPVGAGDVRDTATYNGIPLPATAELRAREWAVYAGPTVR